VACERVKPTGWTVWGTSPGVGEIFHTRPERTWCPPSLQYNGYRASFPGLKQPRRGVDHPHTSGVEVRERVELYFYSPSGSSGTFLFDYINSFEIHYLAHTFNFIWYQPNHQTRDVSAKQRFVVALLRGYI